jgi:6-phosphogluconolactonase (cycloisomerase 2 family)
MTISTTNSKVKYDGNDITIVFDYAFKIFRDEDLEVFLTDTAGVSTLLVLDTDYTVTGAGEESGGTVIYPISGSPLATGERLTINRLVTLKQLTDLTEQGAFSAEAIEEMSDYVTMQTQQLQEQLDRTPKVAIEGDQTGDDLLQEIEDDVAEAAASAAAAAASETNAATSETNAATSAADAEALVNSLDFPPKEQGSSLQALANKKVTLVNKEFLYGQPNPEVIDGNLTFIGTETTAKARKVWTDGKFVYSVSGNILGTGPAISVYLMNPNGNLTLLNTNNLLNYNDIWGDGRFVYTCDLSNGTRSFVVDNLGNLTLRYSHPGPGAPPTGGQGIWGDGKFLYVAQDDGLAVYSVDNSGILSLVDSDKQGSLGYLKVWGDGKFLYCACATEGIRTYSVDAVGNLTFIDVDYQGTSLYSDIWGDGRFIYCACLQDGVRTYSVDNDGNLTFIDVDRQGGGGSDNYHAVWGDGECLYCVCENGGVRVYETDNAGTLTFIDADPANNYVGVIGYENFIVVANKDGLVVYSKNKSYQYQVINKRHQFNHLLGLGKLTTGERDALTPSNGDIIYNTSLNKFQGYENGAWVNLI